MKSSMIFKATVLVFLLVACKNGNNGSDKIVIKNSEGLKFETYQEACIAGDFESAHRYIAKMEEAGYYFEDIYQAKKHVFGEEALYLLSIGDDNAKRRILFLLKQDPENSDSYCDMLVDLIITDDDEAFLKTIIQQYNDNINETVLRKVVDYLYITKGDENVNFVTSLVGRNDKMDLLFLAAVEKDDVTLIQEMAQKYSGSIKLSTFKTISDYFLSKEDIEYKSTINALIANIADKDGLINYLIAKNYDSSIISNVSNAILKESLEELMDNSVSVMSKGLYSNDISIESSQNIESVNDYNSRCLALLEKAIYYKNKNMAQSIIRIMKPNPVCYQGDSGEPIIDGVVVGFGDFYIQHTYSDIQRAKQMLKEANF